MCVTPPPPPALPLPTNIMSLSDILHHRAPTLLSLAYITTITLAAMTMVGTTTTPTTMPSPSLYNRPLRLPHLVLIVGDDLGRSDVGYNDPSVLTPHIDALARSGVRLDAMYTWNWCAPSRASLLTGRYAPRHGYEAGGDGGTDTSALSLNFTLLPKLLRPAYKTFGAGKWHLVSWLTLSYIFLYIHIYISMNAF